MTSKLINRILVALIAAVILTGVWVLGERHGAGRAFERAADQPESAEAQATIQQLQSKLRQTEQELAEAVSTIDAAAARTRSLMDSLDAQMRTSVEDSADLALYRRIESSEKARAVEVESLRWAPEQPLIAELTLIQWQGRDRVSGELEVTLVYENRASSDLSDIAESDSISDELKVVLAPVNFDFRFFQTISLSMLPPDIDRTGSGVSQVLAPDYADIRIIPADERLNAVDTRIMWSDVAE